MRFTSITLRKRSTSCFCDRAEVEDAGVVHEDGERAEALLGVGDRGLPLVLGGDVEVPVGGRVAEVGGDRLALVVEHVGEEHLRALGHEAAGLGLALARGPRR